jgi:hypothetical protein
VSDRLEHEKEFTQFFDLLDVCTHFLDHAVAAQNVDYKACAVTRAQEHGDQIKSRGLRLISLELVRRGVDLWREYGIVRKLIHSYKSQQPDIAHHVALKSIMYGTIAAITAGIKITINVPRGAEHWKTMSTKDQISRPHFEYDTMYD